jgi:hypothetical protein
LFEHGLRRGVCARVATGCRVEQMRACLAEETFDAGSMRARDLADPFRLAGHDTFNTRLDIDVRLSKCAWACAWMFAWDRRCGWSALAMFQLTLVGVAHGCSATGSMHAWVVDDRACDVPSTGASAMRAKCRGTRRAC